MRRPWEWLDPEPVTRRDEVLAALVCDPPVATHPKAAGGLDKVEDEREEAALLSSD
jgi:hypothetical protein